MGILTVAVVTKPFSFEGRKRSEIANNGIRELSQYVDSLITVPNDKLVDVLGSDVPLVNAFESADDVLLGAVQGIAQVITCQGLINVDFADVKTVMGEMGMAMMGSGKAQGEDRARVATEGRHKQSFTGAYRPLRRQGDTCQYHCRHGLLYR